MAVQNQATELTMQGTEFLNPGQTSVLGADQPLYAIIKLIQRQFPDTLGEDKLVVIMGALHIEDKMHMMIGKLLHDTWWATIFSQAEVLTSGRAQSTLNITSSTRGMPTRSRLYRCTCSSRTHTWSIAIT